MSPRGKRASSSRPGGEEHQRTRYVVNAAGVFSDEVSRMLGDDSFSVHPRKGEYMLFDRKNACVRTVIFQTPSRLGKGILVSPTVDGNMFIGPTAVDMDDKRDTSVTAEGIAQLTKMSKKSVPDINLRAVITSFAGVRAQPSTGDFVIGILKGRAASHTGRGHLLARPDLLARHRRGDRPAAARRRTGHAREGRTTTPIRHAHSRVPQAR